MASEKLAGEESCSELRQAHFCIPLRSAPATPHHFESFLHLNVQIFNSIFRSNIHTISLGNRSCVVVGIVFSKSRNSFHLTMIIWPGLVAGRTFTMECKVRLADSLQPQLRKRAVYFIHSYTPTFCDISRLILGSSGRSATVWFLFELALVPF